MFVAGRKRKAQQVDAAAPGSRAQAPTGAAGSAPAIDDRQCARMELNRLLQLGADSTRERDYRVALDHFNRAAALAKNEGIEDARVYEARSRALFKVGDVGRAIDDAKHAIRANPGASGYTCLATILAETGKVASALKVIDDGLAAVDEQDPGFAYLKTLRMSAMYRLDPKCVLYLNLRTDPAMRLPPELVALVLCKLDVRALMRCRMVARHWRALIDTTPGLWSRPTYVSLTPEELLRRQMPGYEKLNAGLFYRRQEHRRLLNQMPDWALRYIFERSRAALTVLRIPETRPLTEATLSALFEHKRPRLATVDIDRRSGLTIPVVDRVLRWSISAQLAEIRVPYETHVDDAMVAAIASGAPKLRILDISGCVNVSVKSMFWAWNATLEDAQGSTALEELYLDDHPDVLELLVYSTRYRHFSGLRVLHIGTYLSTGITSYPRIDRLLDYYQRIPNRQVPFPALVELSICGTWGRLARWPRDHQVAPLISACRLLCPGLRRLSALDASYIGSTDLHEALRDCFPTLERLHLSDCRNLDTQMLTSLIGAQQALPLTSLDLSRCLGVDAHGLVELVSRCRQLVHVNLSRTSADNTVLAALTEAMGMDDAAGVEVLLLEVTSVTGAAVRDFAAACAKRCHRTRHSTHVRRAWRLRWLDIDNCRDVAADAVAVVRDLLLPMRTCILASIAS
ncbi:hypothetical protein H4R21_000181 [Coemansia helicoidea]|uniref:Uncharacterized protein n=1 Tax=Coemansia helicoidea TaxID=1286919 RepID=A0ACC1LIB4_9FUNG|nr:hypothetical protein H4R21_000181 [Coemansia helicoidea]